MFTILGLFFSLGGIIVFAALCLFYKVIVKPYLLLKFYEKQGVETYFYPMVGIMKKCYEDVLEHDDFYYSFKQRNYKNPKPKAFATNMGDTVEILLKDSELIKEYYLHPERYVKYVPFMIFLKQIAGDGVLFAEGPTWKRHRRLVSSVFNYGLVREMVPELITVTDKCLERLKNQDLSKVDMLTEMQVITGEIIAKIFFGEALANFKHKGKPLTEFLAYLLVNGGVQTLTPLSFLLGEDILKTSSQKKLLEEVREFKSIMKNLVSRKMAEIVEQNKNGIPTGKGFNLLELAYKQRQQNPQEAFTDEEIVDECVTFLQAGTDGSAHLLTMSSYFFLKNPQCHKRIFEEIKEYFSNTAEVTMDTLNKMEYMTAFVKECLRMTPTAGGLFPREALVDHKLGSLKIKKGTAVNIPFLSNYFDPEYHQEPEKFMPERWLDEDSKSKRVEKEMPWTYAPFSAGSRNCMGQHLAMNEARVLFSTFLKKFDYTLYDKGYRLRMTERALYEPHDPIVYILTPKKG